METNRREFMKTALYAVLALFGLGFLIPGVTVLLPAGNRTKNTVYFPLIPEEEIPRAGVKKSELIYTVSGKERKARVFIVSSPKDLIVLSATCSHLGCLVNYNKEKGEFICPCHSGRYDRSGRNIGGPPPGPLNRLPVRIEQGQLLVGMRV
jgi:cytochrome b6-f complex iron-sulfur subunit